MELTCLLEAARRVDDMRVGCDGWGRGIRRRLQDMMESSFGEEEAPGCKSAGNVGYNVRVLFSISAGPLSGAVSGSVTTGAAVFCPSRSLLSPVPLALLLQCG